MRLPFRLRRTFSVTDRYRLRWLLYITLAWTLADQILWLGQARLPERALVDTQAEQLRLTSSIALRALIVLCMSGLMAWLLVFRFKRMFQQQKRQIAILYKGLILLACSFMLNFLSQFAFFVFIENRGLWPSLVRYWKLPAEKFWLLHGVPMWIIIFTLTQLLLEVNEKYSPGVFADILTGRYRHPQQENRIVLFMDLKDSTPIAERLGNQAYFLFIRDFIHAISSAILEQEGFIYQYVGDEVVASWPADVINGGRCLASLIEARKNLQARSEHFRRQYNITPEFRAGIHCGPVTVGEIGLIKRDLAMSGDTMNTTARIRSACNELQQKYLCSQDFVDLVHLSDFQIKPMGGIELKGKKNELELFALNL